MRRHDLFGGILWLIIGVGLVFGSVELELGSIQSPGPGFMPFMTGCVLALMGFLLAVKEIRRNPGGQGDQGISLRKFWPRGLSSLLTALLYGVFIKDLGFLLSTFLLIFVLLKILGSRKWLSPFLISILTTVGSYLLFSVWLRIRFPAGLFGIG
jgi:putative tricarboxylic transport membrane protein